MDRSELNDDRAEATERRMDVTPPESSIPEAESSSEPNVPYALPPAVSPQPRPIPPAEDPAVRTTSSMAWLVGLLAFILLTTHLVPSVIERVRYAWVRGRQRAEYESAGEVLQRVRFDDFSQAFQLVSQRVGPSVVHISCDSKNRVVGPGIQLRPMPYRQADQGSGVIVDAAGFIVTNYHVVAHASKIEVRLSDGRAVPGEIIGQDPPTDLAVIKVEATGLIAAEWGDSDELPVGSPVWAVGSPFGLENSITFGILSAKHRAGKIGNYYQDFLQTDAAVNPGNSGGPLVDVRGRVVGINTAIVGDAYQGVSFAVPSRVARKIYREILERGSVTRGWLGVIPANVTTKQAQDAGMDKPEGARVVEVVSEYHGAVSPAYRAGLRNGDIIVQWGEHPVRTSSDLFHVVAATRPGSQVDVTLWRSGRKLTLPVLVEARQD